MMYLLYKHLMDYGLRLLVCTIVVDIAIAIAIAIELHYLWVTSYDYAMLCYVCYVYGYL
jgi:hypothetical protein